MFIASATDLKVVKSEWKIFILLRLSKSVTYSVVFFYCKSRFCQENIFLKHVSHFVFLAKKKEMK